MVAVGAMFVPIALDHQTLRERVAHLLVCGGVITLDLEIVISTVAMVECKTFFSLLNCRLWLQLRRVLVREVLVFFLEPFLDFIRGLHS